MFAFSRYFAGLTKLPRKILGSRGGVAESSRQRCKIRKSTFLQLEELESRLVPSSTAIVGTSLAIEATSGGGQATPITYNFANTLNVTVENAVTGRPAAGINVTFNAPASGASGFFSNGSITISGTTDSGGGLEETFMANAVQGGYSVTAKISVTNMGTSFGLNNTATPTDALNDTAASGDVVTPALTPPQVKAVYGFNSVPNFQVGNLSYAPNGQGQTIAILDPFSDPDIVSDLQTFSKQFGLLQMDGQNGDPTFTQLPENGSSVLPSPQKGQFMEIDQDVEWAHAIAPGANIVLVEINSLSASDVENGLTTAAKSGASVVSMSFLTDHDLEQTPPAGMTYVSAAGDAYGDNFGSVGSGSTSTTASTTTFTSGAGSNDLIVGGTQLPETATQPAQNNDAYPGEQVWDQNAFDTTTWTVGQTTGEMTYSAGTTYGTYQNFSNSTGAIKSVPLPSWQTAAAADVGLQTPTTPTNRMVPDVSMLATRVVAVDETDEQPSPWGNTAWGTSLATPMWAGLIAIANEGRHVQGLSPLNSTDDPILPAVYNLPSFDFNHVTSDTQYAYDQATGLGTPKANLIIPALAAPDGQLPNNGQLTIEGNSPTSDTISVNVVNVTVPFVGINRPVVQVVQVQVNNLISYFPVSEVNSIVVDAFGATDTVNIKATPAGVPLTINLGSGIDTVNINGLGGGQNSSGLGDLASVNGGTGADTLNVNDPSAGSAAMTSYYVTDRSIQRIGGNGVIFEDLSQVTLNGVSPASTGGLVYYNIGSIPYGVVSAFPPPGAATLNVNGSGSVGRNEFIIGGSYNYFFGTLQTLNVSTGTSGENNVSVDTLPKGVALNISSAGATNDTVYVGDGSEYSLTGIQGAINVNNSSGQTRLIVDGSGDPGVTNYDLANNTLSVLNGPTITYQGAENFDGSLIGVTSIAVIEGNALDTFEADSIAGLTSVFLQNLYNDTPKVTGAAAGSVQVN